MAQALGPQPAAAITFDDGWRDTRDLAFPVLLELGATATVFVVTGKIGSSQPFWQQVSGRYFREAIRSGSDECEQNLRRIAGMEERCPLTSTAYRETVARWRRMSIDATEKRLRGLGWLPSTDAEDSRCLLNAAEIRTMARAGIDFGSHTENHIILSGQPKSVVEGELERSRATLEQLLRRPVHMLAYPNGDYSEETISCARWLNYRIACTPLAHRLSLRDDPLELPRVEPEWDGIDTANDLAHDMLQSALR